MRKHLDISKPKTHSGEGFIITAYNLVSQKHLCGGRN